MTEHKFTDEDIIDSLRYHQSGALARCCQCAYLHCYENCSERLAKDALDLINRQKAEVAFWMDAAANAKKEAVKELAERLKKECLIDRGYEILQEGAIDHLVKEFTEE